jgi:hypothetical protein
MHFEILVEDRSGKVMLDILVPKIIGSKHTFMVHAYRGVGRIPKDLRTHGDPSKRILLEQLPKLLRGYGAAFAKYPRGYSAAVVVVCDLDDRCLKLFRDELLNILEKCRPKPASRFCIAVEEGEAWLLGDIPAIKAAYPHADDEILDSYRNDAICGTWEKLADSIETGGANELSKKAWYEIGRAKSKWAEAIAPHMDVEQNASPSFNYFRQKIAALAVP